MIFLDKRSNVQIPSSGNISPRLAPKVVLYDILLKLLVKDLCGTDCVDPKLRAYGLIKEIFSEEATTLMRLCQKSEICSILKTFDLIEIKVVKNIKVNLQNWNVR
jgi:hypothetical protein